MVVLNDVFVALTGLYTHTKCMAVLKNPDGILTANELLGEASWRYTPGRLFWIDVRRRGELVAVAWRAPPLLSFQLDTTVLSAGTLPVPSGSLASNHSLVEDNRAGVHATGIMIVGIRTTVATGVVLFFAEALCVTAADAAADPPARGGAEFPPLATAPPIEALTSAPALTFAVISDAAPFRIGMCLLQCEDEK